MSRSLNTNVGLAPVALFVYGRLDHTLQTIQALLANELAAHTDLIVYSDGARNEKDAPKVEAVRECIKSISGFKSVVLNCRETNFGLAKNIIDGVSETLRLYDRIIVLEDDLITSPMFLKFMNDALACYEFDERVVSIHGYVYPVQAQLPDVFFLPGADCWGWATWRRGWNVFNADGSVLLKELARRKLFKDFNFDNSYPYVKMLKDQVLGRNNSWAIRWYASAFLADKLTLYPGRSLVRNIGNDDSGTHCYETDRYDVALAYKPVKVSGVDVVVSQVGRDAFVRFFRASSNNLVARLVREVKRLCAGL